MKRWLTSPGLDCVALAIDRCFPPSCAICGIRLPAPHNDSAPSAACRRCLEALPLIVEAHRCESCSVPTTREISRCERCRRVSFDFAAQISASIYTDSASSLIRSYKFRGRRAAGGAIARLMAQAVPEPWRVGIIVPVPPRRSSLRARGYDAVGELAIRIGEYLGMSVEHPLASSGRRQQKSLSFAQRAGNVSGRFSLTDPKWGATGPVVLVDDVFTTGATLSECARLLKVAGTPVVFGVTFALEL